MIHKINHANIKEWAKNYDGPQFDGILCDPPYELGFMGKSWDSSGIAFDTDMWADLYKLLKPGAHILAFSGSRTYHRMAVAIEDAGFEIRDQLIWMYGSGFPKSLNIGKSVEAFVKTGNASKNGFHKLDGERRDGRIGMYDTVEEQGFRAKNPDQLGAYDLDPTTDEAKLWNGYGTALKPAHEPCVLARKPLDKGMTVANNVLKHGTGGLNIDGTRVGTETTRTTIKDLSQAHGNQFGKAGITYPTQGYKDNPPGRFPANLIHDGSDEVEAVFPQTTSSPRKVSNRRTNGTHEYGFGTDVYSPHNDSGSASRYFFTAKPDLYCSLCYGIMEVCENNAKNAQTTSQLGTQANNTAQDNVAVKQAQEPKDKKQSDLKNAHNAVDSSTSTNQTTENTAQWSATQNLKELLDLTARYAESQCLKCQTSIAQKLVVMATENTGSPASRDFMQDFKSSTHNQNLVKTVEILANIDITQTTINLTKLCGFAHLATDERTKQANQENSNDFYRHKYCSKASKSERNAGLEGFEVKASGSLNFRNPSASGRSEDAPSVEAMGGLTAPKANHHPTVKPLSLTKYLATLIKPPTGGRLLVPFSGSGSEMIGALQAGWEYVEGVELTEEYIPISEARIKYWTNIKEEKSNQMELI